MARKEYRVVIIGGGIVGLSTALALTDRYHGIDLVVLEKEDRVARHQTGRNSGVVHSGVYYQPGSLKARLCVEGVRRTRAFCEEHGLPYQSCGKVIVAVTEAEFPRLEALYRRGRENGVPGIAMVDRKELREIEPAANGLAAVHCPQTAIVDFGRIAEVIASLLASRGATVRTSEEVRRVERIHGAWRITTNRDVIQGRSLVNCAGLYADRIAMLAGAKPDLRIVPFRGEFYYLPAGAQDMVRGLIYPVPDPNLPFLGVHITRTVHGRVKVGPNAVLAFSREGYSVTDLAWRDVADTLRYPGFWRLARRYWRTGAYEVYRSISRAAFVASVRRLAPAIGRAGFVRAGCGVRAQAVRRDGSLVDDFSFVADESSLHVLNAPSPAATAAPAIGDYVAERAAQLLVA